MPAELSEQIQRFEEKYAENPDSLVFARLADLYRKAGDADRGLRLLQDGLERHPDYLSGHIVRARCLRDLGRRAEAEEAFERVLERDEQNLVALRGLAEIARERGELEEAERRYEELLALDPHNEDARSALEGLGEGGAGETPGPGEAMGDDRGEPRPDDVRPGGGADAGSGEAATVEGAGVDAGEDADDEGPWWRSDEPAPEGADQSDVFSLAGPGEEAEPAPEGTEEAEAGSAVDEAGADTAPEGTEEAEAGPPAPEPTSPEEAEFLGLGDGEADEPGAREDAPDGELPAEEELTERIEEIADTSGDGGGQGPEDDGDAEDLLTETLADLYETQGFYREAVEMYEELLEERPEDEELRARLEAARAAMDEDDAREEEAEASPPRPELGTDGPASAAGGERAGGRDAAGGGPGGDDEVSGGGAPSGVDVAAGREPASARSHLRALLRGEAGEGPDAAAPEDPDPGP